MTADEDGANGVGDFNRNIDILANVPSRRAAFFELTWVPPLSFYKITHGIPSADIELVLNPHSNAEAQRRGIESVLGIASKNPILPGGVGDFNLTVENMYLYNANISGPRCDSLTYYLELENTRLQVDKIQGQTFSQRTFDVSPSTYALTVAYQDLRAGSHSSISSSKFKSYNAGVPLTQQELNLDRMFIQFSGLSFPSPDSDPKFDANQDNTTQRYVETQLNSGSYYDSGGSETIQEYHARGSYYHFLTPRSSEDASTRVTVNNGFKNGTDVANLRVLLFDHSKTTARITVSEGRTISVELVDQ